MTRLLNRGNDELISATLSALDLQHGDRYLDVGFGGGVSFEKAGRVVEPPMLGVDPSREAVAGTRDRLSDLVHAGRLELRKGGCEDPPVEPASVDKLLTANTVTIVRLYSRVTEGDAVVMGTRA